MDSNYPTDEEWLASLDDETRSRAGRMIAAMTELGAPEPVQWVRSEITDNFPQVANFVLLRGIWPCIIDEYRKHTGWIDGSIHGAKTRPQDAFSDAGLALKKMREAGVSREEIASVARMVAYETAELLLYYLDNRRDVTLPQQLGETLPGWVLMECTPDGETTGRTIDGVHNMLLSLDPSGREGHPEE